LSKAQNRLDDAEHRFQGVLAPTIELLTFGPSGASWLRVASGSSVPPVSRQGLVQGRVMRRGASASNGSIPAAAQAATLAALK
jgi:hypothetical protein